jgi:hypothetical protein
MDDYSTVTYVRFKDVSAVTAVTVTLTVPPAPIVAVPDAAPVWFASISCQPRVVKIASATRTNRLLELVLLPLVKAFTVTVKVADNGLHQYRYLQ